MSLYTFVRISQLTSSRSRINAKIRQAYACKRHQEVNVLLTLRDSLDNRIRALSK